MTGFALALLFTLGWIPLYYFRAEDVTEALAVYTPSERVWVRATVGILSLHMTLGCIMTTIAPAIPLWRAVLSGAVFAFGLTFWFSARPLIGPVRRRRLPHEPPVELRCDGAFGLVRHPMYLGYLILAGAPVLAAAHGLLVLSFFFVVVVFATRAVQEERRLHAQLGERYAAYCGRVRRLIPFVW